MVKNSLMLGIATSALALLAGCGSSYSSSSEGKAGGTTSVSAGGSKYGHTTAATTAAATTPASSSTGAASGVAVASKHAKLGTVLAAGPKKMTVYLFEADKGSQSACSGACASVWPPVTTAAAASAVGAARSADLGTITRSDGTKQVTYNGHPLYFYAKDKDGGDAYGQGSKSFGADWYVLAPSGNKIDHS